MEIFLGCSVRDLSTINPKVLALLKQCLPDIKVVKATMMMAL